MSDNKESLELDDDFLMYVYSHSMTQRALFSREHVKRLYALARLDPGFDLDEPGIPLILVCQRGHGTPLD